jgi:hypothetical protein
MHIVGVSLTYRSRQCVGPTIQLEGILNMKLV